MYAESTSENAAYARSTLGNGVDGNSDSGIGVIGRSESGTGAYGVSGDGYGVFGHSVRDHAVAGQSGASGGASIYGFKLVRDGNAVLGDIQSGDSPSSAVAGTTTGHGAGIYGRFAQGRGGVFKGGEAQVRLSPSYAATHPTSGKPGDLFVDSSKRLWFCKGGPNWKQLA